LPVSLISTPATVFSLPGILFFMESSMSLQLSSSFKSASEQTSDVYDDGYLRVEHKNYYIACGGVSLKLPRTEFLVVSRLVQSANRIVAAEDLWVCGWGNKRLNPESLHVHIYRLRNKLMPYGISIETMVNVGYKLIVGQQSSNPR
jgi:DNA-binding response OmpR family regulator